MHELQEDMTPVAAKDHVCQECGSVIPKGTMYHLQTGLFDGSWYHWRVHADCAELYWQLNKEYARSIVDDYMPTSEFDLSDMEHLRGKFPHAVCRQELRREISEIKWQKRKAVKDQQSQELNICR